MGFPTFLHSSPTVQRRKTKYFAELNEREREEREGKRGRKGEGLYQNDVQAYSNDSFLIQRVKKSNATFGWSVGTI